jgi:hypothetical protein
VLFHAPELAQVIFEPEIPGIGISGNETCYKSMGGRQKFDLRVLLVILPRQRGVELVDLVDEIAIPLREVRSENDLPAVCDKRLLELGTQSLSSLTPAVSLAERASK